MENVADMANLCRAAHQAARGVRWKQSVQLYMLDYMPRCLQAKRMLMAGDDFRRGFVYFDVYERGKLRHITAVHYSERVIQKCVSQNALIGAVWPRMTAGCSANIKGRGMDYAIKRTKRQLVSWYRKHGTDGYILQVDFADYFANLDHAACMRLIEQSIIDPRLVELLRLQIDAYGNRGLGLGSEPNQVLAVALPYPIDYLGLRFPGIEASGRYMDDSYFIALDKPTLWALLNQIRITADSLGIVINERKTKIVKLSRGFVFLKKRFTYGQNGSVVVRPCRKSITRQRRKLKKIARLVQNGDMTKEQANQSYQSWRGQMLHYDAYRTVRNMDALFKALF